MLPFDINHMATMTLPCSPVYRGFMIIGFMIIGFMVNGINSQTNIYALKDLVNLAKYATGVPLTDSATKLTVPLT